MSIADKTKVFVAAIIAILGIYFSLLRLVQSEVIIRVALFFGSLILSFGILYLSEPGKRFVRYCHDSIVETRKVFWPQRDEVIKMSGIVILFVTVIAIFLYLVDSILSWLLQFLAL